MVIRENVVGYQMQRNSALENEGTAARCFVYLAAEILRGGIEGAKFNDKRI